MMIVFVARKLGLSGAGSFALIQGMVGAVPAIAGLGTNFLLARVVAVADTSEHAGIFIGRVTISTGLSLVVALPLGIIVATTSPDFGIATILLVVSVVLLEYINFDIQYMNIFVSSSHVANLLFLIRSSLWSAPLMICGVFMNYSINLDVILYFWLGGNLVALCIGWLLFVGREVFPSPKGVVDSILSTPIRPNAKAYVNDLALAAQGYLDRFVLSAIVTRNELGVFSIVSTLVNGVVTLVSASVTQAQTPLLIKLYEKGGPDWKARASGLAREVGILSCCFAVLGASGLYALAPYMRLEESSEIAFTIALFAVASVARAFLDASAAVVFSCQLDNVYFSTNLSNAILTGLLTYGFGQAIGVGGAAVAVLISAVIHCAIRFAFIQKHVKELVVA